MADKKTTARKPKIAAKKAEDTENITVGEQTEAEAPAGDASETEETTAPVSIDESAAAGDDADESEAPTDAPMESFTTSEPMKKVRLAKNHDCCIGGSHYHFVAGQVYDVPLNVASVLRRGDLIRPL